MANNPLTFKKRLFGPLTPSNSPTLKPTVRPSAKQTSHTTSLSLETVLGSTTSTPCGFDCLPSSRLFAYCAASSVVVGKVDDDLTITRRYFRANPTASSVNPTVSYYNPSPSTPVSTPEPRGRSGGSSRTINTAASSPAQWTAERTDGTASRAITSRDRIKASTSVALSPDGTYLAVGESGYCPRVLLFSLDFSSTIPLSIITDHSFGVRSLAFSPDSQYLASLGDANDGFLFVWAINSKTGSARLYSASKCTSTIHGMIWVGNALITVGTRHAKVWRLPDAPSSPSKTQRANTDAASTQTNPIPKPLVGRNCLLGPLADSVFTCVSAMSDREAVVCTERGSVCLIEISDGNQKLTKVGDMDVGIASIATNAGSKEVWLGGIDGRTHTFTLGYPVIAPSPRASNSSNNSPRPSLSRAGKGNSVLGLGLMADRLIVLDAARTISLRKTDRSEDSTTQKSSNNPPAHNEPVLGIGVLPDRDKSHCNSDFFTWSSGGQVNFWDVQGNFLDSMKIEVEQLSTTIDEVCNELKILRASDDMSFFVSGDRYGVVKLLPGPPTTSIYEVRAHGAEVTDIAIQSRPDSMPLVATCSRDRMVQVFSKVDETLELLQTLEDHVGAVTHVLFANEGEKLLSCSSDRTVLIREKVTGEFGGKATIAFFSLQVITLKASPVSMVLPPEDTDSLLVSTIDRQITRYSVPDGRHLHSWKPSDAENNSVIMGSMSLSTDNHAAHPRVLVGVSTTDKSVRIYDYDREALLCREFGHTEGVSDVVLLEPKDSADNDSLKKTVISTGYDGIVIIWTLTMQVEQDLGPPTPSDEPQTTKELTSQKTPLRRIISMTKLAEFQKLDGSPVPITPTRDQSPPRLRRKTSRFTMQPQQQVPRITSSSTPTLQPTKQSPTTNLVERVRGRSDRSPSPPSPKTKPGRAPRPSLDARARTKSYGNMNEYGGLQSSATQLSKSLRAYRKRLNTSSSFDHFDIATELSRELELTLNALDRKTNKARANSDSELKVLSTHHSPKAGKSSNESENKVEQPQRDGLVVSPVEEFKPPESQETSLENSRTNHKSDEMAQTSNPPATLSAHRSRAPPSGPNDDPSSNTDTAGDSQAESTSTQGHSRTGTTESASTQSETEANNNAKDASTNGGAQSSPPPRLIPPRSSSISSTVALLRKRLEQGNSGSGPGHKEKAPPKVSEPEGEG